MKGLTTHQVTQLLNQFGENVITDRKKKTLIEKFIEQFNNILTFLLVSAAGISIVIGEYLDGVLIIAIVVLNALFGIYQEAKAEESIAALKKMSVAKVRVLRDGVEQEITSNLLVPGDICIVEEGVKVPADGIVLEGMNMEINESVLTGESLPVVKNTNEEVYSGTIVAKGRGVIQIVKTGMQTKFGQIADNLLDIQDKETPLQRKLNDLTRVIGIAGVIAAIFVFVISLAQGQAYFPAFLLAVSLAVAVVPEGFPAIMTITLAIGVREMAKKKSIVRKLSAIEALGSITLIATDKTGTLTTNKMKVKEVFVDEKLYDTTMPHVENHPFLHMLYNGAVCSTASLVYKHDHGTYDVLGDPTEGALLYMAQDMGLDIKDVREKLKIVDELPFDSTTKRMSVLVESQNSKVKSLYTKGAPESLLEISGSIQKGNQVHPLTMEERKKIETQMEHWARKGLRVLAFSYSTHESNSKLEIGNVKWGNEIFLGMVAIHDAPRPEVREAVQRANEAGIRVVMITGDNERTAEAIGVTAGIVKENDDILTGKQLEEYSDEQLMQVLPKTAIFARTSPFHKHRIVSLYQKLGHVVAVTGDGVNDAIALKQADVGVAMGMVGTDVARETADMVITDDNFASIVIAIEEGRGIIANIKKSIQYLLPCNVSEVLALIVGLLAGVNHIFFPIQLLYVNLVTHGPPALVFAFAPRSSRTMKEPPHRGIELLERREKTYIFVMGIISAIGMLAMYFIYATLSTAPLAQAAVFSGLTFIQQFVLFDLWFGNRSLFTHPRHMVHPIFLAAFLFPYLTQLIILQVPSVATMFNVPTVSIGQFWAFVGLSFVSFVAMRGIRRFIHI